MKVRTVIILCVIFFLSFACVYSYGIYFYNHKLDAIQSTTGVVLTQTEASNGVEYVDTVWNVLRITHIKDFYYIEGNSWQYNWAYLSPYGSYHSNFRFNYDKDYSPKYPDFQTAKMMLYVVLEDLRKDREFKALFKIKN